MNGKIAIDPSLSNLKNYLTQRGYKVENMNVNDKTKYCDYDALIISGMSENFLGMQDTRTEAPVINIAGLTPEDVVNKLKSM